MSPEQFCYWLQGFVELHGDMPSPEQWDSIKEHLNTVFNKVTPPVLKVGPGIVGPAVSPSPNPFISNLELYRDRWSDKTEIVC